MKPAMNILLPPKFYSNNIFIVFNRQKIFSYLVAFSTIVILFGIAFSVTNENAVITSSTVRELPIYNVKTDQKKISLTINCAW